MDTVGKQEVECLGKDECWEILASHIVGRLAVIVDGHPDIFPVNYVVDDGSVLFRTGAGTKLQWLLEPRPVALEIDGYDPHTELAWSVVLRGSAREITRAQGRAEAKALPLDPWQGGPKDHFISVGSLNLSGRRFHVTKADIWKTPLSDPRLASFE